MPIISLANLFPLRAALVSDRESGGALLAPHIYLQAEIGDRLALDQLVCLYGHAVDRQDYGLLQSLYHDDAIDDHSPYFCGPASEYVTWLPGMMANWGLTSHTMSNKIFVLDGDRAQGVISARAWHLSADKSYEFTAYGRYADQYEKRDGVWRFSHRFFILDSSETRQVKADDAADTQGVELGRAGRDDPIYRRLDLFR